MTEGIRAEVRISKIRQILLERQHLQTRLQDLFLSTTPTQLPYIYTKRFPKEKMDSLIFYFDNGIDPDPAFSGPVLGRIYLDEKKRLALALWPIENKTQSRPWRKEILFHNVTRFQFQFLGAKQTKQDVTITDHLSWNQQWPQHIIETPCMIRLSLFQEKEEVAFAFFLTNVEPLITYEGDRAHR
jgi:hypothetical protein